MVGNLDDVLREAIVSPSSWGVLNHSDDSLIPLIIGLMKLDSFSPHLVQLTGSDKLWNVKSLRVGSDVIHQSVRLIFGIHDTEISVDTVVGSLVVHALLKELGKLLIVTELLIMLNEVLKMIWLDDDVETTSGSSGELSSSNAGEADCFPDLWDVCLLCSLESGNVFLEHDIDLGELLIVSNSLEKNLGWEVELALEAFFSDLEEISLVWIRNEVLEVSEILISTLGVRVDKFRVDDLFLESLSSHEQELDKLFVGLLVLGDVDNHHVHGWVLSLDE